MSRLSKAWTNFVEPNMIALKETPLLGPGQRGLFATSDLLPTKCYLRFVKVTVAASTLQRPVRGNGLSGLSDMDETRDFKSLALGPGRRLNVSYHPRLFYVDV